jgi:hypothetical protein
MNITENGEPHLDHVNHRKVRTLQRKHADAPTFCCVK